jgi:hypothetical protein
MKGPEECSPGENVVTDPVEPKKPKKIGVVVLAALVVVSLGAAGTFGTLYFKTTSDLSEQLKNKDREIADLTKRQQDAYGQMLSAQAAKRDAETEAILWKSCQEAAKVFTHENFPGNDAKFEAAAKEVFRKCW